MSDLDVRLDGVKFVQDYSTNNLHRAGDPKADGAPAALCNKRYRVWDRGTDENARGQYVGWNYCPRCEAKAEKLGLERVPVCEWFAGCARPATHEETHPILGAVPACDRCPEIGR